MGSPTKEVKEKSHISVSEKDFTRRKKETRDISKPSNDEKSFQSLIIDAKEKHKEGNESPRLTRQAKESPKSYCEEKESEESLTEDAKDLPKSHRADNQINISKDEMNKSRIQRDSKHYARQQ